MAQLIRSAPGRTRRKCDDPGADPPEAEVVVFGGRSQATGELRLVEAKQVDGRWIVTATVPLDTIASQKFLRVYLNEDYNLLFPLPLRPHPDERDREWSAWVEAGWPVGQAEARAGSGLHDALSRRARRAAARPERRGDRRARGGAGRGQVPSRRTRRADRAVAPHLGRQ